MKLRPLFGASALAFAMAFTAFPVTAVASNEGPDHDEAHGARGQSFGSFDLPDADGPGRMSGILFRRNGVAAFGLEAATLRPPEAGEPGRLRGFMYTLAEPGKPARRIARVIGEFGVGENGHGRYRAVIVRMDADEDSEAPLRLLGGTRGQFRDPRREPGQEDPGPFGGRWILCRP